MKNSSIWKGGILAICLLHGGFVTPMQAQQTVRDSLYETSFESHLHELELTEILFPSALVAASAMFVDNDWLKEQRGKVQDMLSVKGGKKFKADDYIQYSPVLAVYGLNLFGVEGKHSFKDRTIILAMAWAIQGGVTYSMKSTFKEKRPDSNSRNSFPSGHTATAFMGAQYLYEEYKETAPWIGYIGYAAAATTGYLRIYNNRHYINDVVAGACVGIMSTKLAYWLYPKCFKNAECNKQTIVTGSPYCSGEEVGMSLCIRF